MIDAHGIHARLGATGWRDVLVAAGISEGALKNRHGPCPACGGKDRFRFDNKRGRGDFICSHCGAGDGFRLLMNAQGLTFSEARKVVIQIAGLGHLDGERIQPQAAPEPVDPARPTRRVLQILRESCAIDDCEPAMSYLWSRGLWPLPKGHGLRAHASVTYYQDKQEIGRWPVLVAPVRDMCGDLVTVHVTYLEPKGTKLEGFEPRKLLSGLTGREGCAVQLMPLDGSDMGIAEGIETAFSAASLHSIPVWAALNTSLLQKFEPPEPVHKLVIFADRDVAGLDAAARLMERLQERVRLEVRTPKAKDWNDVLTGNA